MVTYSPTSLEPGDAVLELSSCSIDIGTTTRIISAPTAIPGRVGDVTVLVDGSWRAPTSVAASACRAAGRCRERAGGPGRSRVVGRRRDHARDHRNARHERLVHEQR